MNRVCVVCNKVNVSTKCSRCKRVFYCSRKHQQEHWHIHKKQCKKADNNKKKNEKKEENPIITTNRSSIPLQRQQQQQQQSSSILPQPSLDFLPKIEDKKPTCLLVIGMAGSGKTTLLQRIHSYVNENKISTYIVNLDPAVYGDLPYNTNIDIRDTIKYKDVMKDYKLGPNGAIMTSLNLFAARFDQVLTFMRKKQDSMKYCVFDTPGQIEVFTWSASGSIITETLGSEFPTVVLYVIDTPRTTNPVTFMSNMLHACSIMYKTKLPFILVFNKTDVVSAEFATKWMNDFDEFSNALQADTSYMSTFTRSMSLVLDEFYSCLSYVCVSATTGAGMSHLFEKIDDAHDEYFNDYLRMLKERIAKNQADETQAKQDEINRVLGDIHNDSKGRHEEELDEAIIEEYDGDRNAALNEAEIYNAWIKN